MDLEFSLVTDRACGSCPIRHRAVCSNCDSSELVKLEEMKSYRTFAPGQPIMYAGDPLSFVGTIVSGTATIERLMEDGRKQTMGLLLPSDFIGRPGQSTALYDVTAVTEVTLCCFRRGMFEAMVNDTPHIAQRLLQIAFDELDAARDWMLLLGRKTAREKIATFLTMIARRTDETDLSALTGSVAISIPLTREAMADFMGLTLETVSRQFSKLRQDGLIVMESKREIVIPNIAALREATGSDAF